LYRNFLKTAIIRASEREAAPAVQATPRGPDHREGALWPSPLSRTQRKNPQAKRRRLVAPAVDRGSHAASFARSDRRKLLGVSWSARAKRCVGLAPVNMECFDALCVACTEDCAGGVDPHRPCCCLSAPLRRLLSQVPGLSRGTGMKRGGLRAPTYSSRTASLLPETRGRRGPRSGRREPLRTVTVGRRRAS
jgi:hypothetical protein